MYIISLFLLFLFFNVALFFYFDVCVNRRYFILIIRGSMNLGPLGLHLIQHRLPYKVGVCAVKEARVFDIQFTRLFYLFILLKINFLYSFS